LILRWKPLLRQKTSRRIASCSERRRNRWQEPSNEREAAQLLSSAGIP
jgi:hypothetical protein